MENFTLKNMRQIDSAKSFSRKKPFARKTQTAIKKIYEVIRKEKRLGKHLQSKSVSLIFKSSQRRDAKTESIP
jgi:paraquat-inducible protein B